MTDAQPLPPELGSVLDRLLDRLSPSRRELLLAAALPHWVAPELLTAMTGQEDVDAQLAELAAQDWLEERETGGYHMPQVTRLHLLARAQETPERYRLLHRRAAAYFQARLDRGRNDLERLEWLYHRLGGDPQTGWSPLQAQVEADLDEHRLGRAEHLLDYAAEHGPLLDETTRAWLAFYQGRLAAALNHLDRAAAIFQDLAAEEAPLVAAAARRELGQVLVRRRAWLAGLDAIREALEAFRRQQAPLEEARTLVALADAYVALAAAAGGLHPEEEPGRGWARLLHVAGRAPFLAYRWLTRRIAWLPNLYFGGDYQNWIVVRFLYAAERTLQDASRVYTKIPQPDAPATQRAMALLRLRLADLRHRIGRWSQAERMFQMLAADSTVQASPYLQALVRFGQARADLVRGQAETAAPALEEAAAQLARLGDLATAGAAAALRRDAALSQADPTAALTWTARAVEWLQAAGDLVNATELLDRAEELAEETGAQDQAAALRDRLPVQVFMERFPGPVFHFFRRLAVYVAMPITFLALYIFSLSLEAVVAGGELLLQWIFGAAGQQITAVDLVVVVFLVLAAPLLTAWLYHGLYAGLGLLWVRGTPLRFLLREQPRYLLVDGWGCRVFDGAGTPQESLAWEEVSALAFLERGLWRTPSALFSRTLLLGRETTLLVRGIATAYDHFKREAGRRAVSSQRLDLNFWALQGWWAWLTGALILLIATVNYFDLLDATERTLNDLFVLMGGEVYRLHVAGYVGRLLNWTVYLGPLSALTRLLWGRRRTRQVLGEQVDQGPSWPIWLAWGLLLITTLGELYIMTE